MGKCVLLKNLGEGQYTVEMRLNEQLILDKLDEIQATRVTNEDKTVETELALAEAHLHQNVLDLQVIAILNSTTLTPAEKSEQARTATAAQRAQRLVLVTLQTELGFLALEKTTLMLQEQRYRAVTTRYEKTVWSADYAPDLEITDSEVGTLEVMGDEREIVLLPAQNQFRAWEGATDGDLTPVIAHAPMEWLLSTCLVTGWQRYLPTYRFATVLAIIDQDRLSVALIEPKKSLYGDVDVTPLNADQSPVVYTDVPCRYLDCHTVAFSVGDEVVVHYQNQNPATPEVIGFRRQPPPCTTINFYGAGERLRLAGTGDTWVVHPDTPALFGSCYWTGTHGAVSWHGWRTRYLEDDHPFNSPSLYYRGHDHGPLPGVVLGACVRDQHFFAVCRVDSQEILYARAVVTPNPSRWSLLAAVNSTGWSKRTPWYFSASGHRAASAKFSADGTIVVTLTVSAGAPWHGAFRVEAAQPTVTVSDGVTIVTTVKTERSIAVDYSGEELLHIDRRTETITDYGEEEIVTSRSRATRIFIVCDAVQLTYLHYSLFDMYAIAVEGSGVVTETVTRYPSDSIEHLNITGGATRVVSVTRAISATRTTVTQTGVPPVVTMHASQHSTARSGSLRIHGTTVADAASASALINSVLPLDLSYTACDRVGHLICSAPLTQETLAIPELPIASILRSRGGSPMGVG
jgi:hypothetical protein